MNKFRLVVLLGLLFSCLVVNAQSIRFYGNISSDVNRVKVLLDPHVQADVGATDFTVEFWLRLAPGNDAGPISCGANTNWINGDIVVDRDRYDLPRSWGISLANDRVVFGVVGQTSGNYSLCGSSSLQDDEWHHIAVQRRRSDGFLWIYVDGTLEASVDGPNGDISYPNGVVNNTWPNDPYLVLGAEKHYTTGAGWTEYRGWMDEFRISTVLRYSGNSFTVPANPFTSDVNTGLLLHFDSSSGLVATDSSANATHGTLFYGGSPTPGPQWSTETPFSPGTPPAPTYRVSQVTTGFQVLPVYTGSGGTLGGRLYLNNVPVFFYAGASTNRPICDSNDVVVSPVDSNTYMRVTAPAVDDYNHALGQNVSGYVYPCIQQ